MLGAASVMCVAIVAALLLWPAGDPPRPPPVPTPSVPSAGLSPARGLVECFVARRNFAVDSLAGFEARWEELTPAERDEARASLWFGGLVRALRDEMKTQKALAGLAGGEAALARAGRLLGLTDEGTGEVLGLSLPQLEALRQAATLFLQPVQATGLVESASDEVRATIRGWLQHARHAAELRAGLDVAWDASLLTADTAPLRERLERVRGASLPLLALKARKLRRELAAFGRDAAGGNAAGGNAEEVDLDAFALALDELERLRAAEHEAGLTSPGRYLAFALYIVLVNSLLEEYVWRWFVYSRCEQLVGPAAGVVLSALCFTAHHVVVFAVQMDPLPAALASLGVFLAGLAWSVCYRVFRSIWPAYLSHALADVAGLWIGWRILYGGGV
jgi:hypothetical protein